MTAGELRTHLCDVLGSRELTNADICHRANVLLGLSYDQIYKYLAGRSPIPLTVSMLVHLRLQRVIDRRPTPLPFG